MFEIRPTSGQVTTALDATIKKENAKPKHIIVDRGSEFDCDHFKKAWCENREIKPRFGAVGKHGSIAVVERFHRTFKEILRLTTIPEEQSQYEQEAQRIVDWYNEHRPHMTLEGKTPNEVYVSREAANEQPRFELRKLWPRDSPCAEPQVEIEGEPGDPILLDHDRASYTEPLTPSLLHRASYTEPLTLGLLHRASYTEPVETCHLR
ncbi:MAG: hypothetical protein ACI9HK_002415 [Pirellulaceae bacterium]